MNNHELDELLKSAETPARPDEYWREFPKKISSKLHWQTTAPTRAPRPIKPIWAWAVGLAVVCVALGFFLKIGTKPAAQLTAFAKDKDLTEARKCYQELETLFPNQLQAIVFDEQGPHLVLAAEADVPAASPLYLKICGPKGCEEVVTFSGQQIKFNGENCEVLANAGGQVMLVGNHQVWTGSNPTDAVRVEGRLL